MVTGEQVRGVTLLVDEWMGRRVNKLYARGDRVTDEQVRGVTGKLTSGRVDERTSWLY